MGFVRYSRRILSVLNKKENNETTFSGKSSSKSKFIRQKQT